MTKVLYVNKLLHVPQQSESESRSVVSDSLRPHTVHGILQARRLEWVAVPFSNGSSQPRERSQVSRITGRFFTTREARALFGSKIDFSGLANTFLIYLESWKESKHRYPKVSTSLVAYAFLVAQW